MTLQRDPFVDQRAGIGAGDAGFGRPQMAQPARSRAAPPPIRRTAASSRTASVRRRPRPCRRRRSGRHRFRSRAWDRRCAGPAARSAGGRSWPRQKFQRSSGCACRRPTMLRMPRRATYMESLVRSAIDTRDMDALASLVAGAPRPDSPRCQHSEGRAGANSVLTAGRSIFRAQLSRFAAAGNATTTGRSRAA